MIDTILHFRGLDDVNKLRLQQQKNNTKNINKKNQYSFWNLLHLFW